MTGIVQDVRYAFRSLGKTPGFTAVVVLTFALGIGANTAVFSIVDAVLLRPLTYTDPERLVVLHETVRQLGRVPVGFGEFTMWRDNAQSFDQMALMAVAPTILTGSGEPERLEAARVSASLFPMLGVKPALGRTFRAEEEVPGRHRVVVLSDGLWRRRFNADASIVGRAVTLNDEPCIVAGVLPAQFRFPRLEQIFVMGISGGQPELWLPFAISDAEKGENSFAALAKLKHGVSAERARAELSAIQSRYAQQIPNPPQMGADVVPLQEQVTRTSRDMLALISAAIAAVLLIACGNVANLLLVRAATRGPELAVRSALGASHRTLLRHTLVDSLTLAALGGVAGVLLAWWSLPLLLQFAPPDLPRLGEIAIDRRALLFAAILTTATGLVVGLLPARRAAGANLIETLRASVRSGSGRRCDEAIRGLTVSMQAALTVACLGAAGLVIQSLVNVLHVEPGFETDRILTVDVSLSPVRYPDRDARAAYVRKALEVIRNIPGVAGAAVVNRLPLNGVSLNSIMVVEGSERAVIPMLERPLADIRSVNADYFETFSIPLLDGELFRDTDIARPVALVADATAKRAWPGQNPVGKRFRLAAQPGRLVEVVGVVGDVRNMSLETIPSLAVYLPYGQGFLNNVSFALKTTSDPAAVVTAVRTAIGQVDPDVPMQTVRKMENVVTESVSARRFQANLLMSFGAIAVILAAVGVFGVMSYAVAQRSKELGIRMALGASPRSVQRMVFIRVLRLVGVGVAFGVPLAVGAGYALRNVLFGVGPQNPVVLSVAAGLIVLVAVGAGAIPARRAARVDPLVSLRYE
jgi:putative ABC transport system permease protein